MTEIQNSKLLMILKKGNQICLGHWILGFETCPFVPLAASPCPSAIGCAAGECRADLAGWRA